MTSKAVVGTSAFGIDVDSIRDSGYSKATRRLIPFLFVCYFFAYLDRVNVGFAKLQMASALSFSDAAYGLGAGIFFLGYFFFEVPANIIMHKVGARRWISRIMVSWGVISALMATIETPAGFYILRFLLGVAEAGFFPGIILFLTYWYPAERRGRIIALFMAAIPVSGLIGSPLSGWILDAFPGVLGYAGWQWLFVLEAVPSCVLGLVAFFYLTDHPSQAKWLTTEEAKSMEMDLAEEAAHHDSQSIKSAFTDWRVWLLSVTYFFIQTGVYAIAFWLPTLIKAGGFSSSLMVGLVSAIPWGAATIFVILMGRSADATGKRRLHVIIPVVLGSVGLLGSAFFAGNFPVAVFCLTLATMGCLAALTLFWSMPSAFLGGFGAATGLAVINSMGNVAGFASPYAVGLIRDATHSTTAALYVLSGTVLAAAFLITRVPASVDR